MKVVINNCFGGFSLSPAATLELLKRGGPVGATPVDEYFGITSGRAQPDDKFGRDASLQEWRDWLAAPDAHERRSLCLTIFSPDEKLVLNNRPDGADRAHPILVQVVEEMGPAANGDCARLKVVEIPDGTDWEIHEYDGNEHVAEKHRTWG